MAKLIFFFTVFFSWAIQAQLLNFKLPPVQNAPGVKWKSIHTNNYEVVFDEELVEDAKRVADVLETIYPATSDSLKKQPSKISIMLFNQSTVSNGMVTLAPRRSEWYTTPPSSNLNFGNVGWLDLLAVHEMRHVVQFDQAKRGFTKIMYVFLGEFGWALFSNVAIPLWVWEGDAVGTETALTQGGRGRLPVFDMGIRTILLNDVYYNYEKAYLGSYKDYYPNHYPLGYLLSTYVKTKYGLEAWEKIFRYAARKSYNPFAFDNALLKVTGRSLDEMYQDCMLDLKSKWQEQLKNIPLTTASPLAVPKRKAWTNYEFPMVANDGAVYALKSGMADIPKLVKIHNGKEEELTIPGFLYDNPFNLSATKIIWNETRFDPRWGQRDYSVIKTYDLETKKVKQLTKKTRYFSPVYSPDQAKIAVLENNLKTNRALVILNSGTMAVEKRFPMDHETYYYTPQFSPDGQNIVVVKQNKLGQHLVSVNVETGVETVLYGPSDYTLSRPVWENDYLYFNSHQSGLDNIWALKLSTKEAFQITSRPYGAYNAAVKNGQLYFSDYQFQGMEIAHMPIQPESFIPAAKVADTNIKFYEGLNQLEQKGNTLASVSTKDHQVTNYNHVKDAFNAHSWAIIPNPFYNTYDVALFTNNKLSTFGTRLGYQYNGNEDTNWGYAQASYGGLYPMFDLTAAYGGRSSTYTATGGYEKSFDWKEEKASLQMRLPFNFTQDAYLHTMELSAGPTFTKIHDKSVKERFDQNNGTLASLDTHLKYSHTKRMSFRDIYPEYGQVILGTFKSMPFGSNYKGKQTGLNTFWFFPGFGDHHSFWLNLAYEEQRPNDYRFVSEFMLPRGYEFYFKERYTKSSFNYTYPVALFDKNFGMMLNLKRLKQTVFYDHGVGKGAHMLYYNSVGTDLVLDTNLLTLKLPLDIGARVTYILETEKWDVVPIFFSVAVQF